MDLFKKITFLLFFAATFFCFVANASTYKLNYDILQVGPKGGGDFKMLVDTSGACLSYDSTADKWFLINNAGTAFEITTEDLASITASGQSTTLPIYLTGGAKITGLDVIGSATVSESITVDNIYATELHGNWTGPHNSTTSIYGVAPYYHLGLNDYLKVTTNSFDWMDVTTNATIGGDLSVTGSVISEFNDTNGFTVADRANTILTCDGTSRVFSISPASGTTFSYYDNGLKYTKTGAQTVTLDNTYGMHIVYYNGSTLSKQANPSSTQLKSYILDDCIVAMVIYNPGHVLLIGDERHGISMTPATHLHEHLYEKVRFKTGIALNSIVADNTGASNTHAQFGNDTGIIADEDIEHTINAVGSTTGYKIWARTGATGTWEERIQAGYPVLVTGTGRPSFNEYTGGIHHISEVSNNNFVLVHLAATNDVSGDPIIIMGQNQYASVALARAGANTEVNDLSLGVLPDPEIKFIATVIFECRDAYTNDVNARVRTNDLGGTYVDWRTTEASGGTSPTNHDLLSNLRGLPPFNHLSDTDYNRVIAGTSEIFVTGTQEIQVKGNRFDFKNLGVSRSGDTIEVWAPQGGGGGTFDPTNDFIVLNEYLKLKEVSRDTINAPSTGEIKIFLDDYTHYPAFKMWNNKVYGFTYSELAPTAPYIDATGNTSTDFLEANWTTVGSGSSTITANTWVCTNTNENHLLHDAAATKGNKRIFCEVDVASRTGKATIFGMGRATDHNFVRGPATVSIDGNNVQLGYYNTSGTETAPVIFTLSSDVRTYFKIEISNYTVSATPAHHDATISVWVSYSSSFQTAPTSTYSSIIPDSITWYDTVGGLAQYASMSIQNYKAYDM